MPSTTPWGALRTGAELALLLALLPAPSAAQPLLGPSRHFGARALPAPDTGVYLGASLDSFTEFNNRTDATGDYLLVPYNAIDETIGLNFVNLSGSVPSSRWPSVYYRGAVQLGYGHDGPSRTIQDALHDWTDRRRVPRGDRRNGELDAVLALELDRWGRLGTAFRHFIGIGGWTGTPSHELYAHAGFNQPRWRPGGASPFVTLGGLLRVGLPFSGDAFPEEGLSTWYRSIEGVARFPVGSWLRRRGRGGPWQLVPDLALGVHFDNGYFSAPDGGRRGERLGSITAEWLGGRLVFETWNDRFGGELKDHGPTAGAQIYARLDARGWPLTLLP